MQDQLDWLVMQVKDLRREIKKLRKAKDKGPVSIRVNGNGTQVAWSSKTVEQKARVEQVAPGFEEIAQAVGIVLKRLPAMQLSEEDQQEAKSVADGVLEEATKSKPNHGKIRRAVRWLKGLLAPVALGLSKGAGDGVQQLAADAIKQLDVGF
jgi:hypothetical protein